MPSRALSSGTTVEIVLPSRSISALVAEEEERAIALDRSADGAAELIAMEVRLVAACRRSSVRRARRCGGTRTAAGEAVGARLRQHVDLAAGVAAELGTVGVGLDAELADRLHAERGARRAAGRPVREVVLQRAVEQVDVRSRILTVDAHAEPVRDDRAAVAMRKREHARLQQRQVGVVAAVQRQSLDRARRRRDS